MSVSQDTGLLFHLYLPTTTTSTTITTIKGGSVAKWLACWTQAQKGLGSNRSMRLSGNSLRQTVYIHCAFVHRAAKLVAVLLKVARVTAGLTDSNGSPPLGL